jgi:hypothetical protein
MLLSDIQVIIERQWIIRPLLRYIGRLILYGVCIMVMPWRTPRAFENYSKFAPNLQTILKILADNCLLASGHHLCRSTEEYQKLAMLQ